MSELDQELEFRHFNGIYLSDDDLDGFHPLSCALCEYYEAEPDDDLCCRCRNWVDDNDRRLAEAGFTDPFKGSRESKLSREDAEDIRIEYGEGGITQAELAKKWGISQQHASRIILRERWV